MHVSITWVFENLYSLTLLVKYLTLMKVEINWVKLKCLIESGIYLEFNWVKCFNGLSERIQLGEDRNVVNGSYDMTNIKQREMNLVSHLIYL